MANPLSAIIETTKTIPAVIGIPGPQGPTGPAGATGQGVPIGGTTGQALTKIDNTDYNTQWTTITGTVNQTRTLYVGKHGNDANSGLNIDEAKLTFTSALTAAAGATSSLRFAIWCMDGGIYTESITIPQYVMVQAPYAVLQGTIATQGDLPIRFYRVEATANNQNLVQKSGANTTAYVEIMELDGSAFSGVQGVNNLSNNGIIFARIGKCLVGLNGTGIGDQTNGIGHIHANIEDLYLAGNNAVGIAKTSGAGNIVGYVQHILEINAPTGTTGILVGATGEVYMSFNQIIADTAWNVTAGGILRGWVGDVSGVQTGAAQMVNAMTGSMALQNASAVAITGGTISGLTSLANNGNTTLGDASGDTTTINGTAVTIPNGLNFDSNTLVIDAANDRVGIGASPISPYKLDIANVAIGSSDAYYLVRGNRFAGAYIWSEYDDGSSGSPIINLGYRFNAGAPRSSAYISLNSSGNLVLGTRSNSFGSAGDNDQMLLIAATGAFIHKFTDAGTNDTQPVLTLGRNSTNTPAANFASRLLWQLESSTTENRDAAAIDVAWTIPTDANRSSKINAKVVIAGVLTDALNINSSGYGLEVLRAGFSATNTNTSTGSANGSYVELNQQNASSGGGESFAMKLQTVHYGNTYNGVGAMTVLARTWSGGPTGMPAYLAGVVVDGMDHAAPSGVVSNVYGAWIKSVAKSGGGTITNVYGLKIEDQTTGGTGNYALYTGAGIVRIGGTLRHTGTLIGLNGATEVAQSTGWSVTNPVTRKTYDTTTITLPQLAEVVGTIISYLISRGDFAA